jgi:AcrR family transcriptional regulator
MLEAARELLLTKGYAGTTVDAIAAVAEVSPKTVSAAFGSKRGILAELMSPAAFGDRVQQLLGQLRVASDPLQRVRLVAQMTRQIYESLAPEFDLLRGAGTVAPELADLARQIEARRRQNVARLVAYLEEQRVLRPAVAPEEAVDVLWALTSYDLYRMLVGEAGWTLDRYEVWLAELLRERLLTDRQLT